MQRSVWALAEGCVLSTLLLILAGCGGSTSTSSGGGGTNPPPPPAEYLFATSYAGVLVFNVHSGTGNLTSAPSGPQTTGNFGIAATPAASFLYTSDSSVGGIDGYSISSTGMLTAVSGSPFPLPNETTGDLYPPVDSLAMHPSGKFLYAPEPPKNEVAGFAIDSSTGNLTAVPGSPFATDVQPEEVITDPSGSFLYVSNFGGGTISGFSINSSTGALTPMAQSPFATLGGTPDGLVVHPSGKFLYCSLTYSNSIAAFAIDPQSGALSALQGSPFSLGTNTVPDPYSIAQDPAGKFLYVLGSSDGKIYEFTIDANTGALSPIAGSPYNQGVVLYGSSLTVDPSGKVLYFSSEGLVDMNILNIDSTTGALSAASPSYVPADATPLGLQIVSVPQQ